MGIVRHSSKSRERIVLELDIAAAVAATTTFALGLLPSEFSVERLEIIVPTTYAADAANYYTLDVQPHGGAAILQWSTQTSADGALTANVVSSKKGPEGPFAAGQIDLVATKAASAANLPAQTRVRVTCIIL